MADINEAERKLIDELRAEVRSELTEKYDTDYNLLRWARGCGYDKALTLTKLKTHLKLRKFMDLDNIRTKEDLLVDSISPVHSPTSFLETNAPDDNKLVMFEFPGRCDINGMMQAIQYTPFMMVRYRLMEEIVDRMNQLERQSGRMSGVVFIFDMKGIEFDPSLLSVVTGPFRIAWGTLMEQYPEWIHRMLIINVPTFMSILWKAFSPFVPDNTKTKIVLMSDNWRKDILQYVHADHLPVRFGGNMRDENGDEWCRSKIAVPPEGKIPREIYWKQLPGQPTTESLTPLSISAGSKSFIVYDILEENTSIEFFMFSEHDHTFCIYLLPDAQIKNVSKQNEVFVEIERPGMTTIDHFTHKCLQPGVYVIKFGNEKAWFMSVVVKYQLRFFNVQGQPISPKLMSAKS
uniref:CRAL-TRIO domain-containing protein n=1 Tax=Plectus sambesii TaxID=2011161 RepID=A0A914WSV5_9BILA